MRKPKQSYTSFQKIYEIVMLRKFNFDLPMHRFELQWILFLLKEMGFDTKNWDFNKEAWSGKLYSCELADIIQKWHDNGCKDDIPYSGTALMTALGTLRRLIHIPTEYSESEWLQCLASVLSLKKYALPEYTINQYVKEMLVVYESNLNKSDSNALAVKLIDHMFFSSVPEQEQCKACHKIFHEYFGENLTKKEFSEKFKHMSLTEIEKLMWETYKEEK